MNSAHFRQGWRGILAAMLLLVGSLLVRDASASQQEYDGQSHRIKTRTEAHSVGLEVSRQALQLATWSGLSPRAKMLVARSNAEGWEPDDLLNALELHATQRCLDLHQPSHLAERKARWAEAVRLLSLTHPDALEQWILGERRPPRAALTEASTQLRCLIEAMVFASAEPDHGFRIVLSLRGSFGGRFATQAELAAHLQRYPRFIAQILGTLLRSDYRDMGSQSFIWYRKMRFTGRSFNKISERAAGRCGLTPGHTWKPENERHKRCWFEELSPDEREQEILLASAAPALSRHHWGTEFDILGLNPRLFEEGAQLFEAWLWLDGQALDYGFFQPFGPDHSEQQFAHMEERWHWSYYPIAQAIWEHLLERKHLFEPVLHDLWSRLERRWGTRHSPYFTHMRDHWRDYLFHITVPRPPESLP
ncbi:hypothetical protein EA187_13920 [Lujinxingia sediminis]|uniref:D-alanyl-D-alanine carboxypeptidase-like core domain-containing protein n=2 Tax=Lujinxingia sediminis TaxID=2480984 RepID=A0ABY0CQX3_9DELT|nr:hypothetical protein EA187_13920 [Lujinxingia sediminis]